MRSTTFPRPSLWHRDESCKLCCTGSQNYVETEVDFCISDQVTCLQELHGLNELFWLCRPAGG
jgi:hypothetical protein